MAEAITIDGCGPLPVHRPADVAGVCAAVREAHAVYPVGGGTALDIGFPPAKTGIALSTTGLNRVIDYPARDLTVTVQAGITMAKLQATLAAENQWLPVDVPQPDRATVGGAVAANLSGPRRLSQGTFRDFLIGLSFVSDEAVEVKAGGRVVKNVAGYDLMKLHTGAFGSLGVLTQLTFKVKPRPERSMLLSFGVMPDNLGTVLDLLHASASRPAAVELLNARAAVACGIATDRPWVVVVGFEEKVATVAWQKETLLNDLKAVTWSAVAEHGPDLWDTLTALQARPASEVIWKVSALPGSVAGLANRFVARHPFLVHAHAGSGVIWVHADRGVIRDAASIAGSGIEQALAGAETRYTVRRCPPAWKKEIRVWGRDHGDQALMRHVKATLDPKNLFNPGRFVSPAVKD
jgi:glycolate dehydrogenase FAD-binding subunit